MNNKQKIIDYYMLTLKNLEYFYKPSEKYITEDILGYKFIALNLSPKLMVFKSTTPIQLNDDNTLKLPRVKILDDDTKLVYIFINVHIEIRDDMYFMSCDEYTYTTYEYYTEDFDNE